MLIATKNMTKIIVLKSQFSGAYEMKDLGAAKKILGMEIQRDRGTGRLYLSQRGYIENLLERFNMQNYKVVSTPLVAHFKLSAEDSPRSEREKIYDLNFLCECSGQHYVCDGMHLI